MLSGALQTRQKAEFGLKMLYLGRQEEFGAHLGHASMYFESYKSIAKEIISIGVATGSFQTQLLFISLNFPQQYMT